MRPKPDLDIEVLNALVDAGKLEVKKLDTALLYRWSMKDDMAGAFHGMVTDGWVRIVGWHDEMFGSNHQADARTIEAVNACHNLKKDGWGRG